MLTAQFISPPKCQLKKDQSQARTTSSLLYNLVKLIWQCVCFISLHSVQMPLYVNHFWDTVSYMWPFAIQVWLPAYPNTPTNILHSYNISTVCWCGLWYLKMKYLYWISNTHMMSSITVMFLSAFIRQRLHTLMSHSCMLSKLTVICFVFV